MSMKKVTGLIIAALVAGVVLGSIGIATAGPRVAPKAPAAAAASATVACPNVATCEKAADGTCPTDGVRANGGACATGGAVKAGCPSGGSGACNMAPQQ